MKHPHKITMSLTDAEFDAIRRYAGLDAEKRSIWCREAIMAHISQKDDELHSSARAAGYRLIPIEVSEVLEA